MRNEKIFLENKERKSIHMRDMCVDGRNLIKKFRREHKLLFNDNIHLVDREELQACLIWYKVEL